MRSYLSMIHFGDKIFVNDVGYSAKWNHQRGFRWTETQEPETKDEVLWLKNFDEEKRPFVKVYNDYSNVKKFSKTNRFIQELCSSDPEKLIKTEELQNRQPRILKFDIETETTGAGQPDPYNNPITMIGYRINDEPMVILEDFDRYKHFVNHSDAEGGMPDVDLIRELANTIVKEKIDIIAGYNSNDFDMPYILHRMMLIGMDTRKLAKGRASSLFAYPQVRATHMKLATNSYDVADRGDKVVENCFMTPGRVLYDIYSHSVLGDTSLSGIANRKMKTVAKWYKLDDVVTLEMENMQNTRKFYLENPELFREYLESDIKITSKLCDMYLPREMALSDIVGLPLNVTLERDRGTLPAVKSERAYYKAGYKVIDRNIDRYKYSLYGGHKTSEKSYEGAYTDIYRTGRFPKIYKLDFGSFYPSTIIELNLGPETTKVIVDDNGLPLKKPYRNIDPVFVNKGDCFEIELPDKTLNAIMPIRIDFTRDSILKGIVAEDMAERFKYKRLHQSNKGTLDGDVYLSFSNALKILINSYYGLEGAEGATTASMVVALTITGVCRYLIKRVIEYVGRENVVEVDTDGIYVTSNNLEEDINDFLRKISVEEFGLSDNHLVMEKDEYGAGYFFAKKNYILQKIDEDTGKVIGYDVHGSSLKGTNVSQVESDAVQLMIDSVLERKMPFEEATSLARDISSRPLDDFMLSIKLKDERSYHSSNRSTLGAIELIKQMKSVYGRGPTGDESIDVYRSRRAPRGLSIGDLINREDINFKQYYKRIDKIIDKFKDMKYEDLRIF